MSELVLNRGERVGEAGLLIMNVFYYENDVRNNATMYVCM